MRVMRGMLSFIVLLVLFGAAKAEALGCWVCANSYDTCLYYAESNYQAWQHGCDQMYTHGSPQWNQCSTQGAQRYSADSAQCDAQREQCLDWCETERPPRDNCPIVIDFEGRGIRLTSVDDGVVFDIDGDGIPDSIAWTDPQAGDGFLALDRNRNGVIDSGRELFGDSSPQRPSDEPHGFRAMALLDEIATGGNDDGVLTSADAAWSSLLIWVDVNHNGRSEPDELADLATRGITEIDLAYRESRRRDSHGNELRFLGRVRLSSGSWTHAIDVFFQPF